LFTFNASAISETPASPISFPTNEKVDAKKNTHTHTHTHTNKHKHTQTNTNTHKQT